MLAVILEFDVIEGQENDFRAAWVETTEVIYHNFGGLGSRLHKSDDGKFIAYAQWPDLNVYESDHNWSADTNNARERMRATLKTGQPRVLHKLLVDTDLLKNN